MTFASPFIYSVTPALAQLDESCKVTLNGQTLNVGFGGEFRINNLPTGPDLFRVYAICTKDGKTRYGRSGFFVQIALNRDSYISELDMVWQDTPFLSTAAIKIVSDSTLLTQIGSTTQIRVTALLSDSTQKDVTSRGFGTTYFTSNTNVVTVSEQGLATATGVGTVLITANNEGATAVTRLTVSPQASRPLWKALSYWQTAHRRSAPPWLFPAMAKSL